MNYLAVTEAQLCIDEEVRNRLYRDTKGKWTIGIGRNLTDVGVHDDEIKLMCANDLAEAERTCRRLIPNFVELSDARKSVVLNMAFNLGYDRLSGFKATIAAIQDERWEDAARQMMNSKWAGQVGMRAMNLARTMRSDRL